MSSLSVKQALELNSILTSSDSPQLDCQILMGFVLDQSRAWLIAHDDYLLDTQQAKSYHACVEQRRKGKPIAYITGVQEFWSLDFNVTPKTLIPRPDTELLVETLLNRVTMKNATIIDLGTGAGPIAVSIAYERPDFTVFASDRIKATLDIAKGNSLRLNANPVHFIQADWLSCFAAKQFDAIVSNPPYIEALDPHLMDLGHEPIQALVAARSGMADIQKIISSAHYYLKTGGMILIEHGYNQQDSVQDLLQGGHYDNIEPLKDLSGQPRAVLATLK